MDRGMSRDGRAELVEALRGRYLEASRAEKSRILDEFVAVTGYHRKHALRVIHGRRSTGGKRRSRNRLYEDATREALVVVWEASDRICGKRLKAALPGLLTAMEIHGHLHLDPYVRDGLLKMSAATIDRALAPAREKGGGTSRRRKNSHAIKRQIPVRTFGDWGDAAPGHLEADFVVHCGGSMRGSPVHSFVLTDISSGWTEAVPLIVREQSLVVEALRVLQRQLPFDVLGMDTDNDGAFINESLITYCREEGITQTRSRAGQKNDQAWVEQKNGAIVRRLVGYDRYEGAVLRDPLISRQPEA